MDGHGVVGARHLAPDAAVDLLRGKDLARVLHEKLQNVILARGERDGLTVDGDALGIVVDRDGPDSMKSIPMKRQKRLPREHHIEFEERHKKGDILSLFFEEYAEAHLIQPTFVMDHPVEISPLTKKKAGESGLCRAFRAVYERLGNGKRLF